jgi:hypothetical protein
MTLFKGQASRAVVSPGGKVTALACHPYLSKVQNRLLKVCYVPATSTSLSRLLFLSFLQWPLTVLMKQTMQAVHAIKQSILLRCL